MGNLRARPAGCFMSGRARTKSRGQGRQSHRLIHVEIYVLATLIAVVPIGLVVLAVRFGPGLFALGGDAGEPARAGLAALRETFLWALYAVLAFALVAALLFARRIANPLAKMLSVTRDLTSADVWGRADLRSEEH